MPQRAGFGRATSSSGLRRNLIATPTWADEIFGKHNVGTLRRECLDHLLIYGERHLRRILAEYAQHYNEHRPHQSREQRPPLYEIDRPVDMTARITSRQVVHGLISEYRRAG